MSTSLSRLTISQPIPRAHDDFPWRLGKSPQHLAMTSSQMHSMRGDFLWRPTFSLQLLALKLGNEVASIVASCVLTRYVAISGSGGLISFTKDLVSGSGLTHSSSGRFSLGDTISESEFALIGVGSGSGTSMSFPPLSNTILLCGSKYKTAFFRIVKMKLELPMLVFEVPVSTITFCLVKTISERWPSLAVNVSHR
ncbi:hypothetical protein LWI28_024517 [Acer negundo]|uniref:Uncharacterized protein n=1 Tax=Acer negundo TaxID=4023 RepID=A0AAD5IG26_ACENE|nr:hypothetical protein LWI28_024517 [Acer negundo]